MNSQQDSLTLDETVDFCLALSLLRRLRHTTGCDGCDDAQREAGNKVALCQKHDKEMQKYYESK